MNDNIKLPPLPDETDLAHYYSESSVYGYTQDDMQAYALEAVRLNAGAVPEPCRPDILERLSYHARERDDLTLEQCLSYLAEGWKKVRGRTERQLVMQLTAALSASPAPEPIKDSVEHYGGVFCDEQLFPAAAPEPHKPLFAEMIAQHPGLAKELAAAPEPLMKDALFALEQLVVAAQNSQPDEGCEQSIALAVKSGAAAIERIKASPAPEPQGICEWTHCPHRVGDKCCEDPQGVPEPANFRDALERIAAIENLEWGSDWEEIEEARSIAKAALAAQPPAEPAQPVAQAVPDAQGFENLLSRYGRQHHRMGELWERCQGKGWPEKEGEEFNKLRDESIPNTRQKLLSLLATVPPEQPQQERKPLSDAEREQIASKWRSRYWTVGDIIDEIEAAHGITSAPKDTP